MSDGDLYQDYSSLSEFYRKYKQDLKRDFDQVCKVRSNNAPFNPFLTVQNPKVIHNRELELTPTRKTPCVKIKHYFITRAVVKGIRITTYIKISKYEKDNYSRTGLKLHYHVINKICSALFYPKKSEVTPIRVLDFLKNKKVNSFTNYSFAHYKFDCMFTEGKKVQNGIPVEYYSDYRWDKLLGSFRSDFVPFALHLNLFGIDEFIRREKRASGGSNRIRKTKEVFLESLLESESLSMEFFVESFKASGINPNDAILGSRDTSDLLTRILSAFTLTPIEEVVLSRYINVSVLKFLSKQEIPLWTLIELFSFRRQITDNEINYLNESFMTLLSTLVQYPNSINYLVYEIFYMLISRLLTGSVLSQCQFCCRLIRHRKGKKYCSRKSEGRDCGKKHENKKYYSKHGDKIRSINRAQMRKLRKLYKQHGISNSKEHP